jgi:hypothetical protein
MRLPLFIILRQSRMARLDTSGYIAHTAAAVAAIPAARPAANAILFIMPISFQAFVPKH